MTAACAARTMRGHDDPACAANAVEEGALDTHRSRVAR
jgi:hypothetical protein